MHGLSRQRAAGLAGAWQHRQRGMPHQPAPVLPARQLGGNIRAHQQHEPRQRKASPQPRQRIHGEAGAQPGLDIRCQHPAAGNAPGAGHALRQRCHAARRLQRIAWRDHQPDLVQPQRPQRLVCHMAMPGMGGVEAAAQQADPPPPTVAMRPRRRHGAGRGQAGLPVARAAGMAHRCTWRRPQGSGAGPTVSRGPASPAGKLRRITSLSLLAPAGAASGPGLPGTQDMVAISAELFQAHRPARMQPPSGDADLGAEAELTTVAELG